MAIGRTESNELRKYIEALVEGIKMEHGSNQKKYASVTQIHLEKYNRVIVISDIHGDYDGFLGVLEKTAFSDLDALVVVGDIIERGSHSLRLLRLIMEYDKRENVYILMGNNEDFFLMWCDGKISDAGMHGYLKSKENSIMIDMAEALHMKYETVEQMASLRQAICENYKRELQYLRGLPQIFESEYAVFAHAGLEPGDLDTQDYEYVLAAPAFYEQPHRFAKKVIVGHWPTSNYCVDRIDANVRWNRETNVISIDGGNSMKSWRQINYLILDPKSGNVQSGYYDDLPKIKVLENQEESEHAFTLVFPNTQIGYICEKEMESAEDAMHAPDMPAWNKSEYSLCYFPSIEKKFWIEKERIYDYKGKTYCWDFTTYDLPIKAGEIVSLCSQSKSSVLIKKNGIVGNYKGSVLFM